MPWRYLSFDALTDFISREGNFSAKINPIFPNNKSRRHAKKIQIEEVTYCRAKLALIQNIIITK